MVGADCNQDWGQLEMIEKKDPIFKILSAMVTFSDVFYKSQTISSPIQFYFLHNPFPFNFSPIIHISFNTLNSFPVCSFGLQLLFICMLEIYFLKALNPQMVYCARDIINSITLYKLEDKVFEMEGKICFEIFKYFPVRIEDNCQDFAIS